MNSKLEQRITSLCASYKKKELLRAAADLSSRYNSNKGHKTDFHRVVYLATRMPATCAVLKKVFSEVSVPKTILDCGAGPGTSIWAFWDFPITSLTLLEKDLEFVKLGKKILESPPFEVTWKTESFLTFKEKAELILFSYSLNEIDQEKLPEVIQNAYAQTENFIVIVEPGTPDGFDRIKRIRTQLLSLGMSLHAPCPHHNTCPMKSPDWCHFSTRLPRTSLHRTLKKGTLGHEDEKYSYLIASKSSHNPHGSRVLRHPAVRKGHSIVGLCTPLGLEQRILTGKERKKLSWGSLLED